MRAFVLIGILSCVPAVACAAPAEQVESESTERTIVLRHDIETSETDSAVPVTLLNFDDLLKTGANTPAEALRQMPSYVGNTETENDASGGDGSAFVNLFALGHENTLVLINGRRTVAFEDINGIPLGALFRVEVLKGGGGAANWGPGAVGGLVNFMLLNAPGKAPFEGAEINLLYGNTTDKDARVLQGWVRGGVATEQIAIAAAAEYYDRDAIFSRDRDISASADRRYLGGTNQGSPTFPGRVTVTAAGQVPPGSGAARILIDPSTPPVGPQSYRAYGGPNSSDPLNFREFTPAIPAMEKYQTYVTARYKPFGEALQIYGDLLYAKRKQDNALAPVPFGLVTGAGYRNAAVGIPENFTNAQSTARQQEIIRQSPFNPFPGTQLTQVFYRSIDELGLRRSFYDYDYYRYVAGINGDFSLTDNNFVADFGYDAGVVYERADRLRIDSGDARRGVVLQEVISGRFNPFIGLNTPSTGTAPTFTNGVQTGTAAYDNVAALQNASYIGRTFNYGRDFLADAKVYGNLFPHLWQGGISVMAGYEYRHNRSKSVPDPTQTAGDQLGFTAAPSTTFHQDVNAWFGELLLPVTAPTNKIPGVHLFELDAAYRFEKTEARDQLTNRTASFDIGGGDFRVAARYQPFADLTFRASYSRASRAPEPNDLFAPVVRTRPPIFDLSPFPQPEYLIGGNRNTRPEITDNYSAGVVISPRALPGFNATVDAYQFFTTGVIVPSSVELGRLLLAANGRSGGRLFAERINREFGTFLPIEVDATTGNFGKRLVNGIDTTARYQLPWTHFGTLIVSLGYNYFLTWKGEPVESFGSANFTGDYNNGTIAVFPPPDVPPLLAPGAIPRHKGFLRGEYEWKGFNFVATTNYISSYLDDPSFILYSEYAPNGERGPERTVSDYITLDLQASYEFTRPAAEAAAAGHSKDSGPGKAMQTGLAAMEQGNVFQRMLWGTKLRVGVVNAFDRRPPTVLGAFNDNYDTSLYSIRNRYWYVGLTKTF